jgi:hypothetical protein
MGTAEKAEGAEEVIAFPLGVLSDLCGKETETGKEK